MLMVEDQAESRKKGPGGDDTLCLDIREVPLLKAGEDSSSDAEGRERERCHT